MPCYDPNPIDDYVEKVNKLTRMLCTLLTHAERRGFKVETFDKEIFEWWEDHKVSDKKRLAQEIARAKREQDRKLALAKLTAAERKALGL